jgi:hypothetical protein
MDRVAKASAEQQQTERRKATAKLKENNEDILFVTTKWLVCF